MENPDVIEGFLIRSGLVYDGVDSGLWIIHDEHENIDNIVHIINEHGMDSPDPHVRFRII